MRSAIERLWKQHYTSEGHAFNIYEKRIASLLSRDCAVLDAGCGATAPVLVKLAGQCQRRIGVDLVPFDTSLQGRGLQLLQGDLCDIKVETSSVDLVISRSVLEHIPDVEPVYRELNRILKPGGKFLFLVPNLWDYVSVISYLIPNRFHQFIVKKASGRPEWDTFPTYYKSNTRRAIRTVAEQTGFELSSLEFIGQYPYMFEFNTLLFRLGICYDKLVCRHPGLDFLRGWILAELQKPPERPAAPAPAQQPPAREAA